MITVASRSESGNRFPAPGRSINSYFRDPVKVLGDLVAEAVLRGDNLGPLLDKAVTLAAPSPRGWAR